MDVCIMPVVIKECLVHWIIGVYMLIFKIKEVLKSNEDVVRTYSQIVIEIYKIWMIITENIESMGS